jgi:hypothetical protein
MKATDGYINKQENERIVEQPLTRTEKTRKEEEVGEQTWG